MDPGGHSLTRLLEKSRSVIAAKETLLDAASVGVSSPTAAAGSPLFLPRHHASKLLTVP